MYCLRLDSATFMNVSQSIRAKSRNSEFTHELPFLLRNWVPFCAIYGVQDAIFPVFHSRNFILYTCRHVCLPSKCKYFFSGFQWKFSHIQLSHSKSKFQKCHSKIAMNILKINISHSFAFWAQWAHESWMKANTESKWYHGASNNRQWFSILHSASVFDSDMFALLLAFWLLSHVHSCVFPMNICGDPKCMEIKSLENGTG